jgi:hypothetical protein
MVIKGKPKIAPSRVMQVIKSISAREFFKLYPEINKRYFWGGKLWTQSYLVEIIGNANEKTIRKYVQNQLIELDSKEKNAKQLGLFKNSVACGRFFIYIYLRKLNKNRYSDKKMACSDETVYE